MKIRISIQWWDNGAQHEKDLLGPIELDDIRKLMKYSSDWQDTIAIGPFDISQIDSLKIMVRSPDANY